MTPRHRQEPVRTGSAVKRAVVTSVLSALALTSVTITAAAVTLTNASPRPESPVAAAPDGTSTAPTDADPPLAPPVEVEDGPIGIPDIALVVADGPELDAVPSTAVAAYQRAAAVLGGADKRCHLEWTLVAAVGQVVTGHGSTAGSELDQQGMMRPKHAGKPLTGRNDKRVPDSDAGRLDGDPRFDRPVGPMQLSPATWAVVGVDSDGDGRRNPHDIDDAALAVSVLLCSGDGDLRRRSGRVDGVRRINDDRSFVETVLAVDRAYRVQMSQAADTDPVVVPGDPHIDIPADLPTDVPIDLRTNPSTDLPAVPSEPPSPTATDPVTWVPTPTPPTATQPPRDPTDPPVSCATDTPEPTDPATTEPTDTPTISPTDTATAQPTDVPTDGSTDVPEDGSTDKPGCVPDPADPAEPEATD